MAGWSAHWEQVRVQASPTLAIERFRFNNRRKGPKRTHESKSSLNRIRTDRRAVEINGRFLHSTCRHSNLLIEYPTSDMVLSFAPHSVDEINTVLDGLASAWDWRRHAVPNRC